MKVTHLSLLYLQRPGGSSWEMNTDLEDTEGEADSHANLPLCVPAESSVFKRRTSADESRRIRPDSRTRVVFGRRYDSLLIFATAGFQ